MKIEISPKLSVYENANVYFEKAKLLKKKLEGSYKALELIEKKIKEEEEKLKQEQINFERSKKIVEKLEWYEKFNWSFSSKDRLILIGKDQSQNEFLVRNHLNDKDLFFHADIQGAATVILKNGIEADINEKLEAAQLAASYSKAWKEGYASINVYSVKKDQVSKSSESGYLSTGGFLIKGEREWFKNMPLGLKIGLKNGKLFIIAALSKLELDNYFFLYPGGKFKKSDIANKLSKMYNIHPDIFLSRLPTGFFNLKK